MLDLLAEAALFASLFAAGNGAAPALPSSPAEEPPAFPTLAEEFAEEKIPARAFLALDLASGRVLAEKNADLPLPPASLTKMLTALVALDLEKPARWLQIPDATLKVPGNRVWFYRWEKLQLRDLLAGLLLPSGNDAAVALAISLAGSEEAFVKKMMEKAAALGLENSSFQNPTGLDAEGHLSTARDLARLAGAFLREPLLRELAGTAEKKIFSAKGLKHELRTTNQLLREFPEKVFGVKTGTTPAAGQCLTLLVRDEEGREILAVVLDAEDRWAESQELVEFLLKETSWE